MEKIDWRDFSDEELKGRLKEIKMQEGSRRKEAKRNFLYMFNAETISAELQKRQKEHKEENKEIIVLIIATVFTLILVSCLFLSELL